MIVTGSDNVPHVALATEYVDAQGVNRIVARQGDKFAHITGTSAALQGAFAALSYLDAAGNPVTATLELPADTIRLGGPRPAVAGALLPGLVHNLRPNPVTTDGEFNLDQFTTDYAYAWSVSRFDPESGQWQDVPGLEPVANSGNPDLRRALRPHGERQLPGRSA